MTNRELLEQVTEAISIIATTGQSYSIGSRSLTRANLTELRNLKNELEAKVAAEGNSSSLFPNAFVVHFEGR